MAKSILPEISIFASLVTEPDVEIAIHMNRRPGCTNCGKAGLMEKRSSRVYGKGRNTLVIKNVPVVVFPHCGTSYLEAKTLHEPERIKLHRKSFAEQKSLDIAAFAL